MTMITSRAVAAGEFRRSSRFMNMSTEIGLREGPVEELLVGGRTHGYLEMRAHRLLGGDRITVLERVEDGEMGLHFPILHRSCADRRGAGQNRDLAHGGEH